MKTSNTALVLAITVAALALTPAHATFRCKDEKGITLIGDTPPPGCARVPMQEVNASGRVIRTIEPTLTPEQIEAKHAADAKKKEDDKAAAEQKRKDLALLSTYSSEKEFDVARDRNIDPLKGRISSANDRLEQLDKREKQLQEEAEFYKAGKAKKGEKGEAKKGPEMPSTIVFGLDAVSKEKATLTANIKKYNAEIEQVKKRYEEDKKRWILLKATGGDPAAAAAAAAAASK